MSYVPVRLRFLCYLLITLRHQKHLLCQILTPNDCDLVFESHAEPLPQMRSANGRLSTTWHRRVLGRPPLLPAGNLRITVTSRAMIFLAPRPCVHDPHAFESEAIAPIAQHL